MLRANGADIDPTETQEWLDSLDSVLKKMELIELNIY